jgi:hypothetical protein
LQARISDTGNDTDKLTFRFTASNTLTVQSQVTIFRETTAVYRDASAWYHIVLTADTSNATANNTPYTWAKYHDFKESFAVLRAAYCSSCHKAQGLTINTIGVMEGEIMSMQKLSLKHKLQSLYVALTRPKQELVIFNKHA